jgi:hypothetical protein
MKALEVGPYIEKLVNAILLGATYELAALYAGISRDTFDRWRKKMPHAKPGSDLALLRDRLNEAEGRAAIGWLAKIESVASQGNWQAAAWKLERRYPETYGRAFVKVAPTTPDGQDSWQPIAGLAALLEVARNATNGHQPGVSAPAPGAD